MNHRATFPQDLARQAGLTLVELLVAMVIGLTVISAGLSLYVSSGQASRASHALAQMSEDASLALSLLRTQVAMAGYSQATGIHSNGLLSKAYTGLAVFGCTGGATAATASQNGLDQVVCQDSTSTPDFLVVRYEADARNTVATSAGIPTDCLGNGTPQPDGSYHLADNRYFVKDHTLSCLGNGHTTAQPLVDNIVDMAITYGVAGTTTQGSQTVSSGAAVTYLTAQEISGTATPDAHSPTWNQVTSVRICLLIRSEQEVLDEALSYDDCSGTATPAKDKRLYRAFVTTVTLQNRI